MNFGVDWKGFTIKPNWHKHKYFASYFRVDVEQHKGGVNVCSGLSRSGCEVVTGGTWGNNRQFCWAFTERLQRNEWSVCVFKVRFCISILVLVLGEKVEIFAEWAGELGHLFAAMVGGAWGVTFPLLDTCIYLDREIKQAPWAFYEETTVWVYIKMHLSPAPACLKDVCLWHEGGVLCSVPG